MMGFLGKLFGTKTKLQPVHLDDKNFHDEVMKSDLPVVVDVWGSNCAPCRQLEPVMMELAGVYEGRVKVCELLADDNPKSTVRFRVMGTPTVLYFKPGGRLVERVSGYRGWLYHQEIIENELLAEAARAEV
jgi:thioredoxin-like negative regulator of GroEL